MYLQFAAKEKKKKTERRMSRKKKTRGRRRVTRLCTVCGRRAPVARTARGTNIISGFWKKIGKSSRNLGLNYMSAGAGISQANALDGCVGWGEGGGRARSAF